MTTFWLFSWKLCEFLLEHHFEHQRVWVTVSDHRKPKVSSVEFFVTSYRNFKIVLRHLRIRGLLYQQESFINRFSSTSLN